MWTEACPSLFLLFGLKIRLGVRGAGKDSDPKSLAIEKEKQDLKEDLR